MYYAELWAEANPLESSSVQSALQQASRVGDTRVALGLDSKQLMGSSAAQRAAAGHHLRPGDIIGAGQGYFKLVQGREGDAISADGVKGMLLRLTAWVLHSLIVMHTHSLNAHHSAIVEGPFARSSDRARWFLASGELRVCL